MNGPFILKHNLLLAMFHILKNPIAVLILTVLATLFSKDQNGTQSWIQISGRNSPITVQLGQFQYFGGWTS